MLELTHPSLHFDPVTIETFFGGESQNSVKITPFLTDHMYRKGAKLKYPLALAPSVLMAYFQPREEFNILSVLKSPMVLMMLFM